MRLLFFCCPEPRTLKWLYAGNAFDEWTHTPRSAAQYKEDFLASSVALQVISSLRALASAPSLLHAKATGARWFFGCLQRHASVCCVNNRARPFHICGRWWNGTFASAIIGGEHKWSVRLWGRCTEIKEPNKSTWKMWPTWSLDLQRLRAKILWS